MSFAFRPTPVLNTLPPPPPVMTVRGGRMRGIMLGAHNPGYFAGMRKAKRGNPWITRSGAMGAFALGQDDDDDDDTDFTETLSTDDDLSDLPMLVAPMTPDASTADYSSVAAPAISSGGSLSIPYDPSALQTGPAGPIYAPGGSVSVPALTAQGTVPAAGSSSIPSGYTAAAPATSLLTSLESIFKAAPSAPAGYVSATPATNSLAQGTIIPGVQDWVVGAVGILFVGGLMFAAMGSKRKK